MHQQYCEPGRADVDDPGASCQPQPSRATESLRLCRGLSDRSLPASSLVMTELREETCAAIAGSPHIATHAATTAST